MNKYDFPEILTAFFSKYLPGQRGLSINTIKAYRDTFIVLFRFLAKKKIKPEKLTFDLFDKRMVECFMEWLETKNGSSISTRNHRLAAIHSFIRYAMMENPEIMQICRDILSIRSKKTESKALDYLSIAELQGVLAQPNTKTCQGKRDLALLSLLYDSGARVQELVDLIVADIRMDEPVTLKLKGKGKKERIVPIMPDTARIISVYIKLYSLNDLSSPLFMNKAGKKLTRSGVEYIIEKYVCMARKKLPSLNSKKVTPHVLRHSKGMHLTEANVNIVYIRDLLGHSSIQITERYTRANSDMKRKALENASTNILPKCTYSKRNEQKLLTFLETLI